jgi:hypothetical protein
LKINGLEIVYCREEKNKREKGEKFLCCINRKYTFALAFEERRSRNADVDEMWKNINLF